MFDLNRIFCTQLSIPRVLPNNHRIRKAAVHSSEGIRGQKVVSRENVKEEEEKKKKEEEEPMMNLEEDESGVWTSREEEGGAGRREEQVTEEETGGSRIRDEEAGAGGVEEQGTEEERNDDDFDEFQDQFGSQWDEEIQEKEVEDRWEVEQANEERERYALGRSSLKRPLIATLQEKPKTTNPPYLGSLQYKYPSPRNASPRIPGPSIFPTDGQ